MRRARRCALTLTEQDLRSAWQRRRRADWPSSFEQAMAQPLLCGVIRAEALRHAQRQRPQPAPPPASRPVPRLLQPTARPTATGDRKRAAANDHDDD